MTPEEYLKEKAMIEAEFRKRTNNLNLKYALAHSPANLGDIIYGRYYTIRVVKIKAIAYNGILPKCSYEGPKITKKLVPFKDGSTAIVAEANIVKINGVEVSK